MKTNKYKDKINLEINQLYNKALDFLAPELNKASNQNLSHKEWEICFGHWLFSYTKIFWKIYHSKEKVSSEFKKKILIPKNS